MDNETSGYQVLGPHLEISRLVRDSLAAGRGVVALESTIIAHGMPYPQNLETALAVEEVIRAAGAVPATIAVLDGTARVGCDQSDIERIAREPIVKASVRDLSVLYARGASGATTVASTATVAARAGIEVFVTGGIGGVHRGWGDTLDISADLEVLGRLPMAVVCAGAKAILDMAATLEYLETKGVTVVGYGVDRFPGFYLRETPYPVDVRLDDPKDVASVVAARMEAGLPGATLVTVPIPAGEELPAAELEQALTRAIADAAERGVSGKNLTPFLLDAIKTATAGRSLRANIALIKNNAAAGAAVARELATLRRQRHQA